MAEDTMLQEAIEALRQNDRARARDLLTRLLKTEQNNAMYWVWLSAAVESKKERLYCLQTAFKLDPQNAAAKRGLIMLGAIPPDDATPHFPLDHPRPWEEKLIIKSDLKKTSGLKAAWANPVVRLFILLGIAALTFGMIYLGFIIPRGLTPRSTNTPGPSPTYTMTPTYLPTYTPAFRSPTPTFIGPTPLWMQLPVTYTPTPLYIQTPHGALARDVYRAALDAYRKGDWPMVVSYMEQVATAEPGSADAYYFIGQANYFMGEYKKAKDANEQAMQVNPNFAPAYLGRAMARKALNPNDDILDDLHAAIQKDPDFFEAYLQRAVYYMDWNNPEAALTDLAAAQNLKPDSPLPYLYMAQTNLILHNNAEALAAAQQANALDFTLLPAYRVLGAAWVANGQPENAVGPLQTYLLYEPQDVDALVLLGTAYNASGDYSKAVDMFSQALGLEKALPEAHYQRGFAYLMLGDGDSAEADLRVALLYRPNDFGVNLALARVYLIQGHAGDALVQINGQAAPRAETDEQKAQLYYWKALIYEAYGDLESADRAWRELLKLPEEVMPSEWRDEAMRHLAVTPTPTPTLTSTSTPSASPTATKTLTP